MRSIIDGIEKITQIIFYFFESINLHSSDSYNYINLLDYYHLNRLPISIAKKINRNLYINSKFPAGKKIYITTDAPKLDIILYYKKRCNLKNMSYQATSGLDIYVQTNNNNKWYGCITPINNLQMVVKKEIVLNEGEKILTLYLPPFTEIRKLMIGLNKQYRVETKDAIYHDKIVVYGSSITQGCASSRPALSYVNLLERMIKMQVLNFGFSESAKGEIEVINHIAQIKANIYVIEYDHNVNVEELHNTHYQIYEIIRKSNKFALIILMSRFSGGQSISIEEENQRIDIIEETYRRALALGDENIEFIRGNDINESMKDLLFSDDRHPNDYGMKVIAEKIYNIVTKRGNR